MIVIKKTDRAVTVFSNYGSVLQLLFFSYSNPFLTVDPGHPDIKAFSLKPIFVLE